MFVFGNLGDPFQVKAQRLVGVLQEDLVLEEAGVDLALGQRSVRLYVVGELDEFDLVALGLQRRTDRFVEHRTVGTCAYADFIDLFGSLGG